MSNRAKGRQRQINYISFNRIMLPRKIHTNDQVNRQIALSQRAAALAFMVRYAARLSKEPSPTFTRMNPAITVSAPKAERGDGTTALKKASLKNANGIVSESPTVAIVGVVKTTARAQR